MFTLYKFKLFILVDKRLFIVNLFYLLPNLHKIFTLWEIKINCFKMCLLSCIIENVHRIERKYWHSHLKNYIEGRITMLIRLSSYRIFLFSTIILISMSIRNLKETDKNIPSWGGGVGIIYMFHMLYLFLVEWD